MKKKIMLKNLIKGKAAVFIDAANILYSQETLQWKIDYEKLKKYLESQTKIVGLFFYTGKVGSLEKQIRFVKKLEKIGYTVIAKEVKFIRLHGRHILPKGNLDVELALDAYRLCDSYDSLLLFSGDSDFAYLLDILKDKGKRVLVFSTRGHISKELLLRAKYIDLRKLKMYIEYKKIRSPEKPSPEV